MNTMRQPTHETLIALPLDDPGNAAPAAAPPHVLWQTLEIAYAPPQDGDPGPGEDRLARVIAMPLVLAASLLLWVLIVEFLLTR